MGKKEKRTETETNRQWTYERVSEEWRYRRNMESVASKRKRV